MIDPLHFVQHEKEQIWYNPGLHIEEKTGAYPNKFFVDFPDYFGQISTCQGGGLYTCPDITPHLESRNSAQKNRKIDRNFY
jgi:hypothetical protein